ncbi:hypothetical protein [Nafulsella turpanensis]|uniref:hypothetical protein n=1 Tax=Nafulsella turpanensis TaxID=1265690 RepID=UPI00135F1368|nr:hypothetical protein [Nafulsella turpanensis]
MKRLKGISIGSGLVIGIAAGLVLGSLASGVAAGVVLGIGGEAIVRQREEKKQGKK